MENTDNELSINDFKTINIENILYKKTFLIKNNIDIDNNIIKMEKKNQTITDNDNDNEENLINTDSTIDTTKTKYIYKKKITFSKNKIKFFKPKKKLEENIITKKKRDEKFKIKNSKKISHFSSPKNLINLQKINSNFNFDKTTTKNKNKMMKTSNNFYTKKNNTDTVNKMSKTSNGFYEKNKIEKKEEKIINNDININNIDNFIKFESKMNNLINSINNKIDINISNECLELINSFFNFFIGENIEMYFNKNTQSMLIIHKSINLILFNAIMAYHISFDKSFLNTCIDYLAIIINISHKAYLLLCENIIEQIKKDINKKENEKMEKILLILKNNSFHIDLTDDDFSKYLTVRKYDLSKNKINFIHEIKYYSFLIQKYIKVLIKNLNSDNDYGKKEDLIQIFNNIKSISFPEISNFFEQKIKVNINAIKTDPISEFPPTNPEIRPPYIKSKLRKKFSLVLDLDETLISLERKKMDKNSKGLLKLRPGLFKFLSKMKKFYEIIIFTSGTKEYADQIIDLIESEEKFFDFRLYREHTLFYKNEFIKDISRIGRPLDKIIIVDNLPQNFRLQKENGIEIKSFFGEDNNDKALECLGNILKKIVNRFNDVRNGILEYKNEIRNKISQYL